MNERIKQLAIEAKLIASEPNGFDQNNLSKAQQKFAELIVEECRTVVTEVYRKTSLEFCGPLLTVDEEIAKHFYGVEE
jgi:hypothetical protein